MVSRETENVFKNKNEFKSDKWVRFCNKLEKFQQSWCNAVVAVPSESSIYCILIFYRSSHQGCFIKKVFLKFSLNSQENNGTRFSLLIKWQASGVFLWIFANVLRTLFYTTPPDDFFWFFKIHPINMIDPVFSSTLHVWRFLLSGYDF